MDIYKSADDLRERKVRLQQTLAVKWKKEEALLLEGSLIEFFKAAWPTMDPAPYQHGWHLEAIAEHLEAVSYGKIRKLCINICPRHAKTLMCSVAWNAWAWCKEPDERYTLIGPASKYMCLSYGDDLAMDNAILTRRLIESEWYRDRWGQRVNVTPDQANKHKFDTTFGGTRISGSFKSTVTGRGAGIRIYDDPHKMDEVESETIRQHVLRLYDTTLKSRITDPKTSAEVLVAQRGHMNDLSPHFLKDPEVVHLNLPAEFDSARKCVTMLGWEDPRKTDGELLWPDRWGQKELAPYKSNAFEWAAQWQQMPRVRGGEIFKDDWWQGYEVPADGHWDFEPAFALASLDTAFKEKEENDYSALTVWWVYDHPTTKQRRIVLVDGWKKRLPLNGKTVQRRADEDERAYLRRASRDWGLVEWVHFTCSKRRVDRLLIEDSARGYDVNRELQRLFSEASWGTLLLPARGEKWIRAHAVVDLFTNEMIYAPGQWICTQHGKVKCDCQPETFTWHWRDWAEEIINDICSYPRGEHDDLVDSMTQAFRHLRESGLAVRREERAFADMQMATFKPKSTSRPLYPV